MSPQGLWRQEGQDKEGNMKMEAEIRGMPLLEEAHEPGNASNL